MQRLSGPDAAFLYGETRSWHMHVSSVLMADPSTAPHGFSIERLRDNTAKRIQLVPQFRWRVVEVPSGGRVNVHRADRPVRIARVHASTFGDRLVAKFGLPVRGFRDTGHHAGPGHELFTSRTVLGRDIVTGDGQVLPAGEASVASDDDDA